MRIVKRNDLLLFAVGSADGLLFVRHRASRGAAKPTKMSSGHTWAVGCPLALRRRVRELLPSVFFKRRRASTPPSHGETACRRQDERVGRPHAAFTTFSPLFHREDRSDRLRPPFALQKITAIAEFSYTINIRRNRRRCFIFLRLRRVPP